MAYSIEYKCSRNGVQVLCASVQRKFTTKLCEETDETRVCVFQFPKDEEKKEKWKWILAIPRKNFQLTKYSKVSFYPFLSI